MSSDPRSRTAPSVTIARSHGADSVDAPEGGAAAARRERYELDWSLLMAQAQNGDERAYRQLLEAVTPYLRSIAARRHRDPSDIEDGVQDILLTVHQIRHTYDPARPFGPWLVAIAQRRLVDRLRRQGRNRARETMLEERHETFSAPEANLYADNLERDALQVAVAGLPPRQREAVTLLKLQEMSLKEAAAASGMSIAALKVSVHRGIRTLRKMLPNRREEP